MANIEYPTNLQKTLYGIYKEIDLKVDGINKYQLPDSNAINAKTESLERKVIVRAERYDTDDPTRLRELIPSMEELRQSVWGDPQDSLNSWREVKLQTGDITEKEDGILEYTGNPYYLCTVVDDDSGKLIGFGYAWREKDSLGNTGIYSHFIGIDDGVNIRAKSLGDSKGESKNYLVNFRNHDLGSEIKKIWHAIAVKEGHKYIKWTVDPLLGANAQLNFNTFGAYATEFKSNVYGPPGSMKGENARRRTDRWTMLKLVDPSYDYHLDTSTEKESTLKAFIKKPYTNNKKYRIVNKGEPILKLGLRTDSTIDPETNLGESVSDILSKPYDEILEEVKLMTASERKVLTDTLTNSGSVLKMKGTKHYSDLSREERQRADELADKIGYTVDPITPLDSSYRQKRIKVKLLNIDDRINEIENNNPKGKKKILLRIPYSMEYLWERNWQTAREWQVLSASVFNTLVNERGYSVDFITKENKNETKFPWARRSNYYVFEKKANKEKDQLQLILGNIGEGGGKDPRNVIKDDIEENEFESLRLL